MVRTLRTFGLLRQRRDRFVDWRSLHFFLGVLWRAAESLWLSSGQGAGVEPFTLWAGLRRWRLGCGFGSRWERYGSVVFFSTALAALINSVRSSRDGLRVRAYVLLRVSWTQKRFGSLPSAPSGGSLRAGSSCVQHSSRIDSVACPCRMMRISVKTGPRAGDDSVPGGTAPGIVAELDTHTHLYNTQ